MRRPVKPFVTEYRGSTRRQTGVGASAPKPDFSNIEPEPPTAELRPAAAGRSSDSQEDSYEAALRAADALFSIRNQGPAEEPDRQSDTSAASSHPSGGRILRVLDEPPSPEMQRLEAERAPKRRGRKPGSKNKPKPVPPSITQEAIATSAEETIAPAVSTQQRPMPPRLAPVPLGAPRTLVAAGDKYAWVRTKLKPGQQWKRRLPKVAW